MANPTLVKLYPCLDTMLPVSVASYFLDVRDGARDGRDFWLGKGFLIQHLS
jgi:hypothetical protein